MWLAAGPSGSWLATHGVGIADDMPFLARWCISTVHLRRQSKFTAPAKRADVGVDGVLITISPVYTAGFDSHIMLVHNTQWSRSFLQRAVQLFGRPAELNEVEEPSLRCYL